MTATAVVFSPAATAAPAASSCGARTITTGQGANSASVSVSRIRVEGGATCQEALAVIRGAVLHKLPEGWSVAVGNFEVPHGLTAQVAVNGHKRVKFALPGT